MDKVTLSLKTRFQKHCDLLSEMVLLDPKTFPKLAHGNGISADDLAKVRAGAHVDVFL